MRANWAQIWLRIHRGRQKDGGGIKERKRNEGQIGDAAEMRARQDPGPDAYLGFVARARRQRAADTEDTGVKGVAGVRAA